MNALCEAAVIAANQFPSSLSERILSLLTPHLHTSASKLRITKVFLVGCFLTCLGGCIRVACYRTLGRFFTWELSVRDSHKLVTVGPYAIVRHPSYTGVLLIGIGNLLCNFTSGSWWTECGALNSPTGQLAALVWAGWWVITPSILVLRIPKEDGVLKKEFGDEWKAWARKTPYTLIPYVY